MNFSIFFEKFLDFFTDLLIENDSKNQLLEFTDNIPLEFAYFLSGLEIDLSSNERNADLLFSISSQGEYSFQIIELISEYMSNGLLSNNYLKKLSGVIRNWKNDEYSNKYLENIWLEFDNSRMPDISYIPGIFYGVNQQFNKIPNNQIINFIEKYSEISNQGVIKNLLEFINNKAKFSHFAKFHSRNEDVIRLFFVNISIENILSFIENYNISLSSKIINFIKKIENYFDIFSIHIDIAQKKILNKIGIEAYHHKSSIYIYNRRIELIKELLKEIKNINLSKIEHINIHKDIIISDELKINNIQLASANIGIHHFKFTLDQYLIQPKIYYWYEGKWK